MVQVSIFYVQGNLRTKASKSGTPVKVVGQSFVKTVADHHIGMQPITTSTTNDEFLVASRSMTLKDPELSK